MTSNDAIRGNWFPLLYTAGSFFSSIAAAFLIGPERAIVVALVLSIGPCIAYFLLAILAAVKKIKLEAMIDDDGAAGGCLIFGAIMLLFPPSIYFLVTFFGIAAAQHALKNIRDHFPGGVKVVP
jgi:hypothetical protein